MKRFLNIFVLILIASMFTQQANAKKLEGEGNSNNGQKVNARVGAAGCLPGKSATDLDLNNVRARIMTGGDMWWDLQTTGEYYIPANSTKTSMFSASLWMGGVDVNGQLKGAFQRYRSNGNDFWPGPLSNDGKAAVDVATCAEYDKHFNITRREVDEFKLWMNDPTSLPDYTVPDIIKNWPAHGDVSKNQSYYLAPFYDVDGDGSYDYTQGDYPYYDISNELCNSPEKTMEGNGILVDQVLKGDQTLWWVFNDNGNIHTESKGNAIGVEIRAQAFAFSTNDVINNMTFYTYEIINRSTFRLTETYFSQWVDTDLGYAQDDYVGCDVKRGLGYCYNGKAIDGNGTPEAYGAQPPAIGVDFFQGPYMDHDGFDNKKYELDTNGNYVQKCDESINGVNFGDGVVDNERFGMRKFLYHNNSSGPIGDPVLATEYYQMLKGFWRDGTQMVYGGDAHNLNTYGPACDFMFPDLTDPCNWGTGGQPPNGPVQWTEETAGNPPGDRRFMQSAGPFTLEPGAVNYITVGIPWARATSGGAFASVELLRKVDDKCQALFDNCFKVLDGPDAPEVTVQELDKQIILYLTNIKASNNFNEQYEEEDVTIKALNGDSVPSSDRYDSTYNFQGYQIYQLENAEVSISDITDLSKARLVAQCDIKDSVDMLVNLVKDETSGLSTPNIMVEGENVGISHSFVINEDKFATGSTALVNHKKYYYVAIAYAYNEYLKYDQDPNNPDGLNGQKTPYLAGRKSALGPIKVVTAIPHITSPEADGTIINSEYGQGPQITRLDGYGNGGMEVDLTDATRDEILKNNKAETLVYKSGSGPLNIKVIDPLKVPAADFQLDFKVANPGDDVSTAKWNLYMDGALVDTADRTISVANEQLFLDLGLSLTISQVPYPGESDAYQNGLISTTLTYADSSQMWLSGVPDNDGSGITAFNWIRSGTLEDNNVSTNNDYDPGKFLDPSEYYEKMLNGMWAPYRMASKYDDGPAGTSTHNSYKLNILHSVDIVFTSDKSKWTRCPVLETGYDQTVSEGNRKKLSMRAHASIDKDGNYATTTTTSTDPNDPAYNGADGMGWFPGYAIDVETGERLNMMFGESSWLIGENGRDMKFNPTSNYLTSLGAVLFGGKHYVYVLRHGGDVPAYDGGKFARSILTSGNYNPSSINQMKLFREIMWVGIPMASATAPWLSNDATLKIRVGVPYERGKWVDDNVANGSNNGYPSYSFTTKDLATGKAELTVAQEALDLISVVPNPYYAYSDYEVSQLDNRVKIVNLPEKCTIKIYNVSGTLVRTISKDNTLTSVDWDLKNQASIPIASGTYILHIDAPGIGEKVVKWFGAMRPVDLNAF